MQCSAVFNIHLRASVKLSIRLLSHLTSSELSVDQFLPVQYHSVIDATDIIIGFHVIIWRIVFMGHMRVAHHHKCGICSF